MVLALGDELRGLASPALWLALSALLVTFLIAPQLPLRYTIDAGYEEGLGSDLPFLNGFNTAERDSHGTYRWTDDGATIRVPGVGQRPLALRLSFFPVGADVMAVGPHVIEILSDGQPLASLPVIAAGSIQSILVPPPTNGSLMISLRTETFSPPGDPRRLGTPLAMVEIVALPNGPASPDWPSALGWLGAATLAWMALRHALGADAPLGRLYGVCVGLVGLAAILDPPRWAAGADAALLAAALAYPLAIGVRAGLTPLARHFGVPLDSFGLGWLSVFCVIAFAMRYGGRLYPNSMHGDIGFHINRFNDAILGLIFILSKNRGVDFPYPPGPYLLVAPFTLLGLSSGTVLQIGAALVDAASAALIYAIGSRIMSARAALLAAAIYVFTAATFMTTWWSFDTHIYSQFFHLLTVATLCWALEAWQGDDRRQRLIWGAAAFILMSLVFLGHFGFLINTTLLVGLIAALTWIMSWRGAAWARAARWPLSLAFSGAVIFAGAFFYSAYIPLFLSQLEIARAGGMSAVAERAPVSRAVMWDTLWRIGLITHFGVFPIPLASVGVWMLARESAGDEWLSRRQVALALMLGSLAVALCFAVMPFITLATNSPRWLMFLAWVVAIGAAVATEALWRRGRMGRIAVLAMGAVVIANTAWIWLSPMLWRIRPPEPF
ncbi:hypothetical protein EKD04_006845 [Chloroflexales bacterium ZM16-3]|nr:hypothetical protein [Chloroflexales bacterium ZM16-3]